MDAPGLAPVKKAGKMRISLLLVLLFLLTLTAGLVTGRLVARQSAPRPAMPRIGLGIGLRSGSPLSDELQLTADQRDEMRLIWEDARDAARSCATDADRIEREHSDRLNALLTPDQKKQYQRLSEEDHAKIVALDARRKAAFRKAVDRTKGMLHADQWQAYEQIIKNQVGNLPDATEPPATQNQASTPDKP
jgi:Spy/CpxP family protein refolding chaperone